MRKTETTRNLKRRERSTPELLRRLLPALALLLVMALAGCSGRNRESAGNTYEIAYDVARPDLITDAGIQGIPENIRGIKTKSVQVCGDYVWFGLYNFGLARLDSSSGEWLVVPVKYRYTRELSVVDIYCGENTVYAGLSGMGIGIYDTASGQVEVVENPNGEKSNSIVEIEKHGDNLWVTTHDGLYLFDTGEKTFSLIGEGFYWDMADWQGEIWVLCINETGETVIKKYDIAAGKKSGGISLASTHPIPYFFSSTNDTLAGVAVNTLIYYPQGIEHPVYEYAPEDFPNFIPGCLAKYKDGFLVCAHSGVVYFNEKTRQWTDLGTDSGLPGEVHAIGTLGNTAFLGTEKGAFIITGDMWEEILHVTQLQKVKKTDHEPGKVVAAEGQNTTSWIRITSKDGLLHDKVTAILPAGDSVWLGSYIFGLTRLSLDDLGIENFLYGTPDEQSYITTPTTELALSGDTLWHGGYQFHGRFNIASKKWEEHPQHISEDSLYNIEALFVDTDKVWMGVRKEGLRIQNRATGQWERYKGTYLEFSPFITDIVRIGQSLYFSMDSGLSRYSEKSNSFKRVEIGVFDIESMDTDGDDLWLGARERSITASANNTGLFRYNTKTRHVTAFNTLPGVRGTHVNKVVTDGPFVWVASQQGLERFCRLTGQWTLYSGKEGLEANDILTLAINGNTLLVGTDNGLYIKTLRQFDSERDEKLFTSAWNAEKAGDFARAAELYSSLAEGLARKEADYILFRVAGCLEKSGEHEKALADYEELMADYPLLLADIEAIYSTAHGMDTYLLKLQSLKAGYLEGSLERALCDAYLSQIDVPLKHLAFSHEHKGNREKALEYWTLVSGVTSNPSVKKEAQKKIRDLTPE